VASKTEPTMAAITDTTTTASRNRLCVGTREGVEETVTRSSSSTPSWDSSLPA
jgi:hypothetical protein